MFRVIHPNRWLFWAIAAVVIAGLFLIFFIEGTVIEFDRSVQDSLFEESGYRVYASSALGLSVRYPYTWQIELDPMEKHTFTIQNSKNFGENIFFIKTEAQYEEDVRDTLDPISEKPVTINGVAGTLIEGESLGSQGRMNIVLLKRGEEMFYIGGSSNSFEEIVQTVKFTD